ncbi:MAG: SPOR domain-containing protein [Gammaproteobacteria bacterium]
MARDYKNAGTRRRGGRSGASLSGGAGLVIGLTLGVALAAGVHLYHTTERDPAPAVADETDATPGDEAASDKRPRPRFDFYRMLPNYEVVIPEQEDVASTPDEPAAVEAAGVYVLQVGSFRKADDADRLRAQLALLGIESRIQLVTIDDADTWHRVRIGPIADLSDLQEMRQKLARNSIEALVIRVGD